VNGKFQDRGCRGKIVRVDGKEYTGMGIIVGVNVVFGPQAAAAAREGVERSSK
jgi:hypothetical protein